MRRPRSTYSLLISFAAVITLLFGCSLPGPVTQEEPQPSEETDNELARFDPLELPGDREIIPKKYPMAAELQLGNPAAAEMEPDRERFPDVSDVPAEIDSLSSQAFCIQLFTSKLFGEARHERQIAEEIFDRPVQVDYEVPYYKVRVGRFADRDGAEEYLQRARTAGYTEAWIVVTNVDIRQAPPLYHEEPIPAIDTTGHTTDYEPTTDG